MAHDHGIDECIKYPLPITTAHIRAEMARFRIKVQQVARDTGIHATNITNYRNGGLALSDRQGYRIARSINERAGFPVFRLPNPGD